MGSRPCEFAVLGPRPPITKGSRHFSMGPPKDKPWGPQRGNPRTRMAPEHGLMPTVVEGKMARPKRRRQPPGGTGEARLAREPWEWPRQCSSWGNVGFVVRLVVGWFGGRGPVFHHGDAHGSWMRVVMRANLGGEHWDWCVVMPLVYDMRWWSCP